VDPRTLRTVAAATVAAALFVGVLIPTPTATWGIALVALGACFSGMLAVGVAVYQATIKTKQSAWWQGYAHGESDRQPPGVVRHINGRNRPGQWDPLREQQGASPS